MSDAERIIAAAVMHRGGPWSVPAPGRHHDVLRMLAQDFPGDLPINGEQGFMTSRNRFVGRREAADIAKAAGQILPVQNGGLTATRTDIDLLFSEDVW